MFFIESTCIFLHFIFWMAENPQLIISYPAIDDLIWKIYICWY